jgi:hypothetical protein
VHTLKTKIKLTSSRGATPDFKILSCCLQLIIQVISKHYKTPPYMNVTT